MTDLLDTVQPEPKRDRWGRYLLPMPDDPLAKEVPWTRATTWAQTLSDKFGLNRWSERMVAKGLAMRPDLLALAAATPVSDKNALDRVAADAKEAAASSSGANTGTAVHKFTEAHDRGERPEIPEPWDDDVDAYVDALGDAGIEIIPEWIERIVVCQDLGVAGTLDRIVRLADGRLVILDLKTGKDLRYAWGEIAIQLAIYAHADAMWNGVTGEYEPMPEVSRETAIVAHVPAGQGRCDLHEVDLEPGWKAAVLCDPVRKWRKVKGLARPYEPDPADAEATAQVDRALIATARDEDEIRRLMRDLKREGRWTKAYAALAKQRVMELRKTE